MSFEGKEEMADKLPSGLVANMRVFLSVRDIFAIIFHHTELL